MTLTSSIVFLKKVGSNIPIGLVKLLNPLGHSGQRKLQLVVGSMAMLIGFAINSGFFIILDK